MFERECLCERENAIKGVRDGEYMVDTVCECVRESVCVKETVFERESMCERDDVYESE